MEVTIIILAICALVVALLFIFRKEVWAYLNPKLFGKFKKKKKPDKKADKKPEEKKEKAPTFTVEDFVPKKQEEDFVRDSSVEQLLGIDEYGLGQTKHNVPASDFPSLTDEDKKRLDDFFKNDNMTFRKVNNGTVKSKSISKQIKDLSPELKALLLDNVLKKRDDV